MTETKPKTTAMSEKDAANYNRVVSHATIRDIRLVGSDFTLKPEAAEATDRAWNYSLSDQLEDWSCDNAKGTLSGLYTYKASCVEGRRKLITATGRYLSTYRLSDLCDEEAGRNFLARVGRFSAYPYFRALFATLTQQSGIMLPPLPVISDGPRWVNSPDAVRKLASDDAPDGAPSRKRRPASKAD
ncbi:MAG: hypothetical protein DI534_16390 [Leifsonia xyli]|nr:MAG: hypothetical protein DI534_16390 [Leifsonia xyli]